ncbi:ChaN family lipoprotein [Chryseobacterium carnipullorum]|uniref:ChaN family lipoprotein n=1 Tax=Chryseobacterium carnipullorum TaxID=1124835 RepID=UPI0021D36502|nr:ChaN family lipoprotein [Chryseobacterium carnipullorum]
MKRDNQGQLNQYLEGKFDAKTFKDSARLWNNYATDYKPLVDFAKDKKVKFIATNIPRRYASQTAKEGLQSLNALSDKEKTYIAQLPIKVTLDTPGYQGNESDDGRPCGRNKSDEFHFSTGYKRRYHG